MELKIEELFKDAELMYEEALKELEAGRIRKAAENAWCATAKATDALLYARTGVKIVNGLGRTREIYKLTKADAEVEKLRMANAYNQRRIHLHGDCFYEGIEEIPGIDVKELIRETKQYIENAKRLSFK